MHRWLLDDDDEPKEEEKPTTPDEKEKCVEIQNTKNCQKSTQTLGRRLYSAVLQGLTADGNCSNKDVKKSETDSGVKQNIVFDMFSTKKPGSESAAEKEISIVDKEKRSSAWQSLTSQEGSPILSKKFESAPKEQTEKPNLMTKTTKESTYTTANSSSNSYASINYTTTYATGAPSLPTCPYSNYHNHNLYNNYINNNYIINVCPNNSYHTPYSNNYYLNNQNTSRSVPQVVRQPYVSNAVHMTQPMWYVQQKTHQAYYPVRNYHTQPFVYMPNSTPLRTTQRWTTPFLKTQTQPCYNSPPPSTPPQAWGAIHGQNLHRNNSTQVVSSSPHYYAYGYPREACRNFTKTQDLCSFPTKHQLSGRLEKNHPWLEVQNEYGSVYSLANRVSTYSTASCCPSASDSNAAAENKHSLRQDELCKVEEESCYQSEDNFSSLTSLSSDDLEKQALEQYSASNDSFYRELEQQAADQYEESGNCMSPPNDREFFGGLLIVDFFVVQIMFLKIDAVIYWCL